jgi:hypothetical protein
MTDLGDEGRPRPFGKLVGLGIAILAGAAAVVANVDVLEKWWCENFGYYCSFSVVSPSITVSSGGGKADTCNTHTSSACIHPSTSARQLVKGKARFVVASQSAGVFIDGVPDNAHKNDPIGTSNIGWLHKSDTPQEFCVTVYARTSACETTVSISGRVEGLEKLGQ